MEAQGKLLLTIFADGYSSWT